MNWFYLSEWFFVYLFVCMPNPPSSTSPKKVGKGHQSQKHSLVVIVKCKWQYYIDLVKVVMRNQQYYVVT